MCGGIGSRLRPFTNDRCKAMVEVAGLPLINYDMAFAKAAGADQIAIVGGYFFDDLKTMVKRYEPDALFIENKDYQLQNALSFKRVLEEAPPADLLVCDIDFIRTKRMAQVMKTLPRDQVMLFVSRDIENYPDSMHIVVNEKGMITDLSKKLTDYQAISTGIFFVPASMLATVRQATEEAIGELGAGEARVESVLLTLIKSGVPVMAGDVGVRDWAEIDTPEEREEAETFVAQHRSELAVY